MTGNRALLLLDLQNDIVHAEGKIGRGGLGKIVAERGVLAKAARVLAGAREAGLVIGHVRVGFRADYADSVSRAPRVAKMRAEEACVVGTWGTEFAAEVAPADGEVIFTKACVNPFLGSRLETWLRSRGVGEVVLGGVATNLVVEATARTADDLGFAVTVLEDCCASPNQAWHEFATQSILPLFGKVIASDAFIGELAS